MVIQARDILYGSHMSVLCKCVDGEKQKYFKLSLSI